MSKKVWKVQQICFCQRIGQEVALEVQVVYPADLIPESNPRVLAHRCSQGVSCNLDERSCCVWAGTNPLIDPFLEIF